MEPYVDVSQILGRLRHRTGQSRIKIYLPSTCSDNDANSSSFPECIHLPSYGNENHETWRGVVPALHARARLMGQPADHSPALVCCNMRRLHLWPQPHSPRLLPAVLPSAPPTGTHCLERRGSRAGLDVLLPLSLHLRVVWAFRDFPCEFFSVPSNTRVLSSCCLFHCSPPPQHLYFPYNPGQKLLNFVLVIIIHQCVQSLKCYFAP